MLAECFCVNLQRRNLTAMEDKNKKVNVNHYAYGMASVLRKKVVFTELRFYQRSEVLFAHH